MLGLTNSFVFFTVAAAFLAGAAFIDNDLFGLDFEKIMLVFGCIIFGAQSVGQSKLCDQKEMHKKINVLLICFLNQHQV
jgi:hypothetical protein